MDDRRHSRKVGIVDEEGMELKDQVISIRRVTKVVKGGKNLSFSALVAVGDERGRVGIGKGKAREVPQAIAKGVEAARKSMIRVPLADTTIPHLVKGVDGAGLVVLRPASKGTGVIAGGAVRVIMQLAGIRDILTKSIRSSNPISVANATLDALRRIRNPEDVAKMRGKAKECAMTEVTKKATKAPKGADHAGRRPLHQGDARPQPHRVPSRPAGDGQGPGTAQAPFRRRAQGDAVGPGHGQQDRPRRSRSNRWRSHEPQQSETGPGIEEGPQEGGARPRLRLGQDRRPRQQGPAPGQRLFPQARLRGRPDAPDPAHPQARLHQHLPRRRSPSSTWTAWPSSARRRSGPRRWPSTASSRKTTDRVKVLGRGDLASAKTVRAHEFSASAVKKIEAKGGKAVVIGKGQC